MKIGIGCLETRRWWRVSSSGGSGMWRVSEGVLTTPSLQGGGGALSPGDAGPRRGQGAHAYGARWAEVRHALRFLSCMCVCFASSVMKAVHILFFLLKRGYFSLARGCEGVSLCPQMTSQWLTDLDEGNISGFSSQNVTNTLIGNLLQILRKFALAFDERLQWVA